MNIRGAHVAQIHKYLVRRVPGKNIVLAVTLQKNRATNAKRDKRL